MTNSSLTDSAEVTCSIEGISCSKATAKVLTNEVHAHNTFENPNLVEIAELPVSFKDNKLCLELPACSVVSVTLN